MSLNQQSYISEVLDRFSMTEAKTIDLPLVSYFKLSTDHLLELKKSKLE